MDTRPRRAHDRGFTLVEILVAIVLVGILTAVVVIGVGGLMSTGADASCQASADAARAATSVHFATTGSVPTSFADMVASGSLTVPSGAVIDTGGRRLQKGDWQLALYADRNPSLVCGPVVAAETIDGLAVAPAAAYGMRQLSWQYTGPLVRVRRTTDGVEQDIGAATSAQTRQNLLPDPAGLGASWSLMNGSGVTGSIVGRGTDAGLPYVDIRFAGTATAVVQTRINFTDTAHVPATAGSSWLLSAGVQLVGGSTANVSTVRMWHIWRRADLTSIGPTTSSPISVGATATRVALSGTASTDAAWDQPGIYLGLDPGAVDITLRVISPNLETARTANVRPLLDTAVTQVTGVGDLDLDALETFLAGSAGTVVTWYDQTGNGRHATEPDPAQQPGIASPGVVSSASGRPAVSFWSHRLDVVGAFALSGVVSVVAASEATFGAWRWVVGSVSVPKVPGLFASNQTTYLSTQLPTQTVAGTIAINGATPTVVTQEFAPTRLSKVVSAWGQTPSPNRSDWSVGNGDAPWRGTISELVLLASTPTSAERGAVERDMGAWFGIAVP